MDTRFDIERLRVASPCSVAWEAMAGDERVRHCDSCRLNVYNTAEMTRAEVEAMVLGREGRLCVRMYRRADGTVLTKDCPVGLRAYARRVGRLAAAAAGAIFALCTATAAQTPRQAASGGKVQSVSRCESVKGTGICGTLTDVNGAVIPGVRLKLISLRDKTVSVQASDMRGEFAFEDLKRGTYSLTAETTSFQKLVVKNIRVKDKGVTEFIMTMEVGPIEQWVGLLADDFPPIEATSDITTTIIRRKIESLPRP
jgi:hypothetical protein